MGSSPTPSTKFYVYVHSRPDGSPFYVGKGCADRAYEFGENKSRSQHHRNVVAKYGRAAIKVTIYPCESEGEAFEREIAMIKDLRTAGYSLVNRTIGGEGSSGCPCSQEKRLKISRSNTGRRLSPETRMKMSVALSRVERDAEWRANIGKALKGRVFRADTKAKLSVALKGKPISQEHREKIRAAVHRPESRAKVSASAKGNRRWLGRKHSAESIAKMSVAAKLRYSREKVAS